MGIGFFGGALSPPNWGFKELCNLPTAGLKGFSLISSTLESGWLID